MTTKKTTKKKTLNTNSLLREGFKGRITKTSRPARKAAPRGGEADQQAATELVLYIDNTSDLSIDGPSGQGRSVLLNAMRKWRKGTYDPKLAVQLFSYLVEAGAKRYVKELGSGPWGETFSPATRRLAAEELEESFRSRAENGEFDHIDTKIGAREGAREAGGQIRGESFTPKLSGDYVGRRVEILNVVDADRPSSYFKPGQFAYVVGQNTSGGMYFTDVRRESRPGEVALLVSKTREMRGGALWFSLDGVRFTGKDGGRQLGGRTREAPHGKDRYYIHTRAGGFRRWVCVATAPTMAAAEAEVERLKQQDDPMWREAEYLISDTRTPSSETPGMREDRRSDRPISMTFGQLPPLGKFRRDVSTRIDPDKTNGSVYWPPGTDFTMELDGHEAELVVSYGLGEFEVPDPRRRGRFIGFKGDVADVYGLLSFLVEQFEEGDEEAGSLASSIMTSLGYEWI